MAIDDEAKKATGKGLEWSDIENLSLSKASFIACTNPINGANMSASTLGRRIRAEFIKDTEKPENALGDGRNSRNLDERRWDGRSADARFQQWQKIKRECTKFHSCMKRISSMELIGSPSLEDTV